MVVARGLALLACCGWVDGALDVHLYHCGTSDFAKGQAWDFSSPGPLKLRSAEGDAFVVVQNPMPAGLANAVLGPEEDAVEFSWNASDGRLWAQDLNMCLQSDVSAGGLLPGVFLGNCREADTWDFIGDRVNSSSGQCLDVGSNGCSSGNLVLPLLPAALPEQQALHVDGMASWGGSVIQAEDGKYHMYAAVFANHSGLSSWRSTSEILHAISDVPEGPFQPREVVACPFAHNPQVMRANDGTYLLWMIGGSSLLASKSLDGPWSAVPFGMADGDNTYGPCNNPAPVAVPGNDTIYLFCHDGGMTGLMTAPSWRGPWTRFTGNSQDLYYDGTVLYAHNTEDPTVWVASDGTWHMLMHAFRMYMVDGLTEKHGEGGYAWSTNGPFGPWHFQENLAAFTHNITFTNGTVWNAHRRERPKVLLDSQGRPTHLYTGVCPPGSKEHGPSDKAGQCFTMVQKVDPSVPLWNFPTAVLV